MRAASSLLLLPLGGQLLVGCASTVQVITVERNVWQEAVVPPPEGAVAAGPLAEAGGISVEGGISGVAAPQAGHSREEGALGHLTALGAGHLRLAGRIDDNVELGLGFELIPGGLAAAAATDLEGEDGDIGFILRTGPQLRLAAPLGRDLAWTFDGDLRLTPLAIQREIVVSETERWATGDGWDSSTEFDTDGERWTKWPVIPRVGTGLAWTRDGVHLAAGAVYQQALVVDGYDQAVWECTQTTYEVNDPCEGPPMPPVLERIWVPGATASFGLQVGRTWLLAQGWAHLHDDHEGVAASAPAGAMITMRVPLFREKPSQQVAPQVAGWRQVSRPPPSGWRQVSSTTVPPGWRMVRPPYVTAYPSPVPPPAEDVPLAIPAGEPPPHPAETSTAEDAHAPPPE